MGLAVQNEAPMTYEDYMSEGTVEGRYDIIDGVRYYMTGATRRHNRTIDLITFAFFTFEKAYNLGRCYSSPSDLLISRIPLRTRQPDVYFMSNERVAQNPPEESADPLVIGPELAVEVLSPSDTRGTLGGKLADYAKLEIGECWLVSSESCTVQVLRLESGNYVTLKIYGDHETVTSSVFPELRVGLDDIFAA